VAGGSALFSAEQVGFRKIKTPFPSSVAGGSALFSADQVGFGIIKTPFPSSVAQPSLQEHLIVEQFSRRGSVFVISYNCSRGVSIGQLTAAQTAAVG